MTIKIGKRLSNQLKEKLEKRKAEIEERLKSFAQKNKKIEGDWSTRFPHFNGESGGSALEKAADEVEEYSALLPLEHSLEIQLREINLSLEKFKRNEYGICENCKKRIGVERLKAYPEAKLCSKCLK